MKRTYSAKRIVYGASCIKGKWKDDVRREDLSAFVLPVLWLVNGTVNAV